jgi:hypothetical protein
VEEKALIVGSAAAKKQPRFSADAVSALIVPKCEYGFPDAIQPNVVQLQIQE